MSVTEREDEPNEDKITNEKSSTNHEQNQQASPCFTHGFAECSPHGASVLPQNVLEFALETVRFCVDWLWRGFYARRAEFVAQIIV
jgi:hypothetical protein